MCFTLFGLTFSIVRATTVAMEAMEATEATWYPGAERCNAERFIEEAREKGHMLFEMH